MALIKSANNDFQPISGPTTEVQYSHPVDTTTPDGVRATGIPMAFQVTSPLDPLTVLLPHALVMHVNPKSFDEQFSKKLERIQTRGGWVEQHWGDDLTEISCSQSTGSFMNLTTGLASVLRDKTIAWDRYRDLVDLYYNNGSVRDPSGAIVLQGQIMLMYDRGTYLGTFRSFSIEETDDSPFAISLDWSFKVERTVLKMPTFRPSTLPSAPSFQSHNNLPTQSGT